MNKHIICRVLSEANYVIKTKNTIRETAKKYNVSKSTVHKDLGERLLRVDYFQYSQIEKIFNEHIKIRHINGGESTKRKYLNT